MVTFVLCGKLSFRLFLFYLLLFLYIFGARIGILYQSEKIHKTSMIMFIVSNIIIIIIGANWSGYTGSETQRWIGLCGFAVSTLLAYRNLKKSI